MASAVEKAPSVVKIPEENYGAMARALLMVADTANFLAGMKSGLAVSCGQDAEWDVVITGAELRRKEV